ncbi:MAG: DnaA/Hda family protein [Hyphomonadaceae bacterium]|nr:DnaA/Hda family protein [Hyphomonadaceae bacterium]
MEHEHARDHDDGGRPGLEAIRAWALSKDELRAHFGEGIYRSYIEQLELALDEEDERIFLARAGGTQSNWLNAEAKDQIARRMSAHTRVYKPIRICVMRELNQKALDSIRARRLDPAIEPVPTVGAPPAQLPGGPRTPQWAGTFSTLCVGPPNDKAVMLGRLIAARSANLRMVMVRGEPGVGKTMLVESIANQALEENPGLCVRLINGQRFTEDFVDALKGRRDTSAFKAYVREADLLIIDDVPRVAGRKQTEEELYDTIMSVYDRGGFVVLTAVAGVSGVAGFGERLAHHLKCATECEIALPDEALRRQILAARVAAYAAEQPGFAVDGDALDMIARRMPVTGRELDGAIRQLMMEWLVSKAPITRETAETALRNRIAERERKVTVDMIKAAVARHFEMSVAELLRKTREKAVSHPRQIAMYLSTKLTTLSLPNIARLFGGYDHTTILFAKRKITRLLQECPDMRRDVEEIMKLLRQPLPPGHAH